MVMSSGPSLEQKGERPSATEQASSVTGWGATSDRPLWTLTTWSNMVKQQRGAVIPGEVGDRENRGRARTRDKEENNINNNMDSSRKSR